MSQWLIITEKELNLIIQSKRRELESRLKSLVQENPEITVDEIQSFISSVVAENDYQHSYTNSEPKEISPAAEEELAENAENPEAETEKPAENVEEAEKNLDEEESLEDWDDSIVILEEELSLELGPVIEEENSESEEENDSSEEEDLSVEGAEEPTESEVEIRFVDEPTDEDDDEDSPNNSLYVDEPTAEVSEPEVVLLEETEVKEEESVPAFPAKKEHKDINIRDILRDVRRIDRPNNR